MLIDWVTARVPLQHLTDSAREAVLAMGDRICCYCPKTGAVRYETFKWSSIRSDSHQLTAKASTDFWLQGSPARVIGEGDAVFGAGESAALDLYGCVSRMIEFFSRVSGIELPHPSTWIVSRVDVTLNLQLDSEAEVRTALAILRNCEGGRYRVSQQAGDTVYWSHTSKLRSAKAYAKGAHLVHLMKQKTYDGMRYTPEMIEAANRLLRLELKLGREWFARHPWQGVTAEQLLAEWQGYFGRMIGEADMCNDNDLLEKVIAVAKTEGRGRAAYGCWMMIQTQGWERAREFYPRSTWYDHLKVLKDAGMGDVDIAHGRVMPLRRRIIDAQVVTSWSQIAA